ncbi:MAG: hypothetical protein ACOYS2_00245 [Patescibacteria group bacterium]
MKDQTKISGFFVFLILFVAILSLSAVLYSFFRPEEESPSEKLRRKIESLAIDIPKTENWKEYINKGYGFRLKYPNDFREPVLERGGNNVNWESKYSFLKNETTVEDKFIGFQVIIYDVRKVKEITATSEFPTKRNNLSEGGLGVCENIEDHLSEVDDFEPEEIFVPEGNYCYREAFLFTLVREEYIFNIVPLVKEEDLALAKDKGRLVREFPEFLGMISNFNLIDIEKPQPKAQPRRVVNAPMPVVYKREGGRLVCDKKNDKPGRSKKTKKRHLDLECCLDPDEYPNPHCYYDPKKYGKYL